MVEGTRRWETAGSRGETVDGGRLHRRQASDVDPAPKTVGGGVGVTKGEGQRGRRKDRRFEFEKQFKNLKSLKIRSKNGL